MNEELLVKVRMQMILGNAVAQLEAVTGQLERLGPAGEAAAGGGAAAAASLDAVAASADQAALSISATLAGLGEESAAVVSAAAAELSDLPAHAIAAARAQAAAQLLAADANLRAEQSAAAAMAQTGRMAEMSALVEENDRAAAAALDARTAAAIAMAGAESALGAATDGQMQTTLAALAADRQQAAVRLAVANANLAVEQTALATMQASGQQTEAAALYTRAQEAATAATRDRIAAESELAAIETRLAALTARAGAVAAVPAAGAPAAPLAYSGRDILQEGADYETLNAIMQGTAKSAEDVAAQELALDRLMAAGAISAEQQAAALAALTAREEKLGLAAAAAGAGLTEEAAGATLMNKAASSNAVREYSALLDEVMGGRMTRVPGTLTVLGTRLGITQKLFTSLGLSIIGAGVAIAGFLVGIGTAVARQQEENRVLLETGGIIGLTQSQFDAMANSIGEDTGSLGTAREAMLAFGATGNHTASQLRDVASAATAMSQLTGEPIKKLTQEFDKLGDQPLQVLAELNDKMNFLTGATLAQIETLVEQGNTAGAVHLILQQLHDTAIQREQQLVTLMNVWTTAFHNLGTVIATVGHIFGTVFDKIASIGAPTPIQQQIDNTRDHLHELQSELSQVQDNPRLSQPRSIANPARGLPAALDLTRQIVLAQQHLNDLFDENVKQQEKARQKQTGDKDTQGALAADIQLQNVGYTQQQEHLQAIKKLQEEIAAAAKSGKLPQGFTYENGQFGGSRYEEAVRQINGAPPQGGASDYAQQQEAELLQLEAREKVSADERAGFELAFWQKKLAAAKQGTAQYAEIYQRVATLSAQVEAKRQADEERTAAAARAAQAKEEADARAHQERLDEIAEQGVQDRVAAQEFEFNLHSQILAAEESLGRISQQQELAGQEALENARYQAELAAYAKSLQLANLGAQTRERLRRQEEQLERQHALKIQQIDTQMAQAVQQHWQNILAPIGQAFSQSIEGIVQGTQTMQQAMSNIFQSILAEFVNMGVQMLIRSIADTIAGDTIKKTSAAGQIAANSAIAATAAMASVAAIPFVGWAMAPGVGASTFALGLSYEAALASAEGGWWEIPQDQLAMVHQREMVLPAREAQAVRDMAGEGRRDGGDTHLHIHGDVIDAGEWFRRNGGAMVNELHRRNRNFAFGTAHS